MLFLGRGHLLRCRSALQRIDERPGMSEALPRSVTSEVCREWDGHLLRTSYLRPQDSVAVLISYRLDPWPVDSGMPPIVAEVFGRTLPRFGMIAGRWLGRAATRRIAISASEPPVASAHCLAPDWAMAC